MWLFDNNNADTLGIFRIIWEPSFGILTDPNRRKITLHTTPALSAEGNVTKLKICENEHEFVNITRLILEFSSSFLSQSIFLKIRLWARDFHCTIVDEGAARPESTITHRNRERIIQLFWYKSISRSKLYLNPFHGHFKYAKKRPSFC